MRALKIENCPKITDFSVLDELENLEYLQIIGSNVLPDIKFIKKLKNLKTFVFDIKIEDGDLTPCLDINHVSSLRMMKHYNVRRKDLPQAEKRLFRGNDDIDEWRKLL